MSARGASQWTSALTEARARATRRPFTVRHAELARRVIAISDLGNMLAGNLFYPSEHYGGLSAVVPRSKRCRPGEANERVSPSAAVFSSSQPVGYQRRTLGITKSCGGDTEAWT